MSPEKTNELLDRLLKATRERKLAWQPSVKIGSFQTDFPDSSIIIDGPRLEVGHGLERRGFLIGDGRGILFGASDVFELRIFDSRGNEVLKLTAPCDGSQASLRKYLEDLHYAAALQWAVRGKQEREMRGERTIDSIMERLG